MARSVRNIASTEASSFVVKQLRLLGCLTGLLVCLCAIGCNNGRQLQADLYQRELRLQEDKIYQLQDCVDEYQSIIRGYRMEVAELKSTDPGSTSSGSGNNVGKNRSTKKTNTKILPLDAASGSSSTLPELEFRSPNGTQSILDEAPVYEGEAPLFEPDAESLPMPTESMPTDSMPAEAAIEAAKEVVDEAPLFIPQSYDEDESESPLVILSADRQEVEQTIPNQIAPIESDRIGTDPTETFQTESAHSENGLVDTIDSLSLPNNQLQPLQSLGKGFVLSAREEVGLELRNGSPEPSGGATLLATLHLFAESFDLADFEGELSFMLAEQPSTGTPNRIARWDFSSSEVQQAWKLQELAASQTANLNQSKNNNNNKPSLSKTIELPLLLPKRLPTDRTLEMWVRVVESSGKKRLTKIEADFLSNPLRLINAEPLAKTNKAVIEREEILAQDSEAANSDRVAVSQWRRARADRLESTTSEVQQVIFEEPSIPAGVE